MLLNAGHVVYEPGQWSFSSLNVTGLHTSAMPCHQAFRDFSLYGRFKYGNGIRLVESPIAMVICNE